MVSVYLWKNHSVTGNEGRPRQREIATYSTR